MARKKAEPTGPLLYAYRKDDPEEAWFFEDSPAGRADFLSYVSEMEIEEDGETWVLMTPTKEFTILPPQLKIVGLEED